MTNAELINELRYCFATHKTAIPWYVWCDRAAAALEAAEQRIAKLESQLQKEGEWIVTTEVSDDGAVTSHINCSRCGFYWREPKHGKAFKRCPNCGARMRGKKQC